MGRWYVHARTYRSPPYPKRALFALAMNDATFVVVEDTEAPMPTASTEAEITEGGGWKGQTRGCRRIIAIRLSR